jgi:hypothetical protein
MQDVREQILVRLRAIIAAVPGVYVSPSGAAMAGRNLGDITGAARPAIILHDGYEERTDTTERGPRKSAQQMMVLRPHVEILLGARTEQVGPQASQLRAALLNLMFDDAELDLLTAGPTGRGNGTMWYEGLELTTAPGESREARLVISFGLSYAFKMGDLAA